MCACVCACKCVQTCVFVCCGVVDPALLVKSGMRLSVLFSMYAVVVLICRTREFVCQSVCACLCAVVLLILATKARLVCVRVCSLNACMQIHILRAYLEQASILSS